MLNVDNLSSTIVTMLLFGKDVSWIHIMIVGIILCIGYFPSIKLSFTQLFRKLNASITIKGVIDSGMYSIKYKFPIQFEAIVWYILKHTTINLKDIEVIAIDKNYKLKKIYIPGHIDELLIKDNIYFKSYLIDTKDAKITHREHSILIYSYTKTSDELNKFLKSVTIKYKKNKKYKLNNQQKIFSVTREKDKAGAFYTFSIVSTDFKSNKRFDNIFFEQKDMLINRLNFFLNNSEYYTDKGIPYTLGILFYGLPGCGKTSTIKAIANYTKRHIMDINLSKIKTCSELLKLFINEELGEYNVPIDKRIIVVEDIDCMLDIVKERRQYIVIDGPDKDGNDANINKPDDQINTDYFKKFEKNYDSFYDEPLNLSFILNLIDGVMEQSGRIIIITTNYPDKLDSALLRPGRIDIKIEFSKCSKIITKNIIEHFFNETLEDSIVDKFMEYKYTPAEILGICYTEMDNNNVINKLLY